ncbi:ubiquitin carboxyl-terminal hydrolase 14, partial [Phenoliferia sp. Uapishka_3]
TLRQVAPQFAERSRATGGYSQQDAQEAWGAVLTALKNNLGTGVSSGSEGRFVEQYMTGEMETVTKSVEAPDEEPVVTREKWSDLKCNISSSTNYMISGINEGLEQDLEKNSPTLSRSAVYHSSSRITRLPSYLTVNLVRFFWRRDISKKTKIMRKVKFPFDLDVMDLVSDSLKKEILPLNEKLKEVDKDRRERAKVRRRVKVQKEEKEEEGRGAERDRKAGIERDPELGAEAMAKAAAAKEAKKAEGNAMEVEGGAEASGSGEKKDEEMEVEGTKDGELVDEETKRKEESQLLRSLVSKNLQGDVGANLSGMYELVAIVTHKGASADGGHYIGWHRVDRTTTVGDMEDPDKAEWYRFDDEKVSTVSREKITTLDGGGEDHSAYILLYASKKLE